MLQIKMNLLKKWVWVFLMVVPGVVRGQDLMKKVESRFIQSWSEAEKMGELFGKLPIHTDSEMSYYEKDSVEKTTIFNNYDIGILSGYSVCKSPIYLSYVDFKKNIKVKKVQSDKPLSFIDNIFEGYFQISHSKFQGNIEVKNNQFYKDFVFWRNSTSGISFQDNELNKDLFFVYCELNKTQNIQINGNKIDGQLVFSDCVFSDRINLFNNEVKQITFQHCTMPNNIYLKLLQPTGTRISFINCHADSEKYIAIDVANCNLNNLEIDYQNFRLSFIGFEKSDENRQVYLTLLENFKNKGQTDSYELLDLEYKEKFDPPFTHWLQTFWWSYGYEKNKIFRNTGIFILVFTFLTMLFYKKLQSAYAINNADTNYGRFINSLIYTNIIFWALKLEVTRIKFRDHLAAASYIMLVYVTGIICLAYMVNYVIQS